MTRNPDKKKKQTLAENKINCDWEVFCLGNLMADCGCCPDIDLAKSG